MDEAAAGCPKDNVEHIGTWLRDKRKRASFAMSAFEILGDGERKSAGPSAAHAAFPPLEMTARSSLSDPRCGLNGAPRILSFPCPWSLHAFSPAGCLGAPSVTHRAAEEAKKLTAPRASLMVSYGKSFPDIRFEHEFIYFRS